MKKHHHRISCLLLVIIIISLITWYISIQVSKNHSPCYQAQCPIGAANENILVNHRVYLMSFNPQRKFADWVAYQINRKNFYGPKRKRKWQKDPNIPPAYTLSPSDYKEARKACGYDRGHQAPLGSFSKNPSWANTNYLSNITPQKSSLNQGPWVKLESAVRHLALNTSPVYIVTGPIYQHTMCHLPEQPNLAIPSAYFKVILTTDQNGVSYAAFIMPQNTQRKANPCQYAVSLATVEKTTGLTIFKTGTKKNEKLLRAFGCGNKLSKLERNIIRQHNGDTQQSDI